MPMTNTAAACTFNVTEASRCHRRNAKYRARSVARSAAGYSHVTLNPRRKPASSRREEVRRGECETFRVRSFNRMANAPTSRDATCWWLKNNVENGKLIEPSHRAMTARTADCGSCVRSTRARYITTALSADNRPVVRMIVKYTTRCQYSAGDPLKGRSSCIDNQNGAAARNVVPGAFAG